MEATGAELRGGIRGVLRKGAPVRDAADEDVGAVSAQPHRRQEGPGHRKRCFEVDRELFAQEGVAALFERRKEEGAGVVHDHIGDTEVARDGGERIGARRMLGEIRGNVVTVRQRRHGRPGDTDHTVPRPDEGDCRGGADAARGTGHQGQRAERAVAHVSGPSYST